MYYIAKLVLTVVLVVAVSEIAKRSSFLGGIVASLPLVSVLAMVWLYVETGSAEQVSGLSRSIFWLVLPSLVLFLPLPWLLSSGVRFYPSLGISMGLTASAYFGMIGLLERLGVAL
jgi:hypothetical protein